MNIYIREMKANRKSLIIWSICIILFVFMGMQKYEAFIGSGANLDNLNQMMATMPKVLQVIMGVYQVDITNSIQYFGVLYPYLLLIASIHSGLLGAGIISKEETEKTSEFLMTKPVSKSKIVTSKLIAVFTNILIVNIITLLSSIVALSKMSPEASLQPIIFMMIGMFFIQILFASIGIGFATISKHSSKSGSMTIYILLTTYFLSLFIDLSSKFDILKILTPFKYFDFKKIIQNNNLDIMYIVFTVIMIALILVFSYRHYSKRDIEI